MERRSIMLVMWYLEVKASRSDLEALSYNDLIQHCFFHCKSGQKSGILVAKRGQPWEMYIQVVHCDTRGLPEDCDCFGYD